MVAKKSRFTRIVDTIRAIGAGTTAWHFISSQAAAVYIWGPLLTALVFVGGLLRATPILYLLPASALMFGAVIWCFNQANRALDRFKERYQKIAAQYDRSIPSCRADVTFGGGSHSICFRLMVQNATSRKLHGCEGWLVSTDRFPNISPARLFWAGKHPEEMSIDLIKDVPRFLQICRIDSNNLIHIATQGEVWPYDSQMFPLGDYTFKIGIKGDDAAETYLCSVKLIWTGNWTTAEMVPVATSS